MRARVRACLRACVRECGSGGVGWGVGGRGVRVRTMVNCLRNKTIFIGASRGGASWGMGGRLLREALQSQSQHEQGSRG